MSNEDSSRASAREAIGAEENARRIAILRDALWTADIALFSGGRSIPLETLTDAVREFLDPRS